jgi:hypothetical protein
MSRRGSLPFSIPGARNSRLNSSDLTGVGSDLLLAARRGSVAAKGATSEELYRREGLKHTADAFEIVQNQLLATLQEYADRVRSSSLSPFPVALVDLNFLSRATPNSALPSAASCGTRISPLNRFSLLV